MIFKGEYILKAVRAESAERDLERLARARDKTKRTKEGTYDEEKIKSDIDAFIDSLEPDDGNA